MNPSSEPEIDGERVRIVHFNDVYNVESRTTEPVGGASRFKTAVLSMAVEPALVLFSGDCIAPSISEYLSILTYPLTSQFLTSCLLC